METTTKDNEIAVWAANMIDQKTEGETREVLLRLLKGGFSEFQKCIHVDVLGLTLQYAWEVDSKVVISDMQTLPEKIFEALKKKLN